LGGFPLVGSVFDKVARRYPRREYMRLHAHAVARMAERGTNEDEVAATINEGERFPAKFGRAGFRRNFTFNGEWRVRMYGNKGNTEK
jgi:hypothetical protein